jgi:lysophospholipase L1-like esterase
MPVRVVVIGDSLSDPAVGGGRYLSTALGHCADKRVVNLAKGGLMVNQMRRKLEREIVNGLGPATHVIVFGGVNDIHSDETAGRVPRKITADLAAIYELSKSLGARVIGVTIAPWGGFSRYYTPKRAAATDSVNAWIHAKAASGLLDAVIDAHRLLSCGDPERLCPEYEPPFHDGLHFGPGGHRVLGQALAAQFAECR